MRFRNRAAGSSGRLLLSALLLGMTACNKNPVEIVDTGGNVEGTWTAISFAGIPLPLQEYIQDPVRGACLQELRAVSLTYGTGGQYTWVEDVYLDCSLGGSPETVTNTITGTYRVEGIKLFMQEDDSESEQEYTFTVKDSSLSLRTHFGSSVVSSVFQKV